MDGSGLTSHALPSSDFVTRALVPSFFPINVALLFIAMNLYRCSPYQLTTSSLDALALHLSPPRTQAALLALVALV
jgi:hypothetical protein